MERKKAEKDLQTKRKSFPGSNAEAGRFVNPAYMSLSDITTYPDQSNLGEIRKTIGIFSEKSIPLHQALGLESQTVILVLDIIHANHAHNNHTKSMLMIQLSRPLVSTIDEKMNSSARITYAGTRFDL